MDTYDFNLMSMTWVNYDLIALVELLACLRREIAELLKSFEYETV